MRSIFRIFRGKLLPAIIAVAAFFIMLDALVTYAALRSVVRSEQSVSHTRQVLSELASVQSSVRDAESSQRGYILTGSNSYLSELQASIEATKRHKENVRHLTADNPSQQSRLDKLDAVVATRLGRLNEGIGVYQSQGSGAVGQFIATGIGHAQMQAVNSAIGSMYDEENRLLKLRVAGSQRSVREMYLTIAIATLFNIGLLGFVVALLGRELREQRRLVERKDDFVRMASHELKTPSLVLKYLPKAWFAALNVPKMSS